MNDKKQELIKLQRKWYKKLAQSGFDDIESGLEYSSYIKRHSILVRKNYKAGAEEHFRRCRIHLERHSFKSNRDESIWRWYTDGVSYRKMVPLFNRKFSIKRSVYYIYSTLKRLRPEMERLALWCQGAEDNVNPEVEGMLEAMINKGAGNP